MAEKGVQVMNDSSLEVNPIDLHVGKKVRERRQKLGWTLVELAERLNVSHQQIQKYEQGTTRISASILYQLSKIFSTNQNYFFEGFQPPLHGKLSVSNGDTIDLAGRSCMNVFLVEDDPADELLTRKALEGTQQKINIHAVHDGENAINVLRHPQHLDKFPRPDLVLLDLNIPKRDGHMVLRELKRDRDLQDIPVVVLTNSISKQEMVSVYKSGASGYICKSFDFEVFKRHMGSLISYWASTVVLPNRN
jgi:CheY-like chemotaxis protein